MQKNDKVKLSYVGGSRSVYSGIVEKFDKGLLTVKLDEVDTNGKEIFKSFKMEKVTILN